MASIFSVAIWINLMVIFRGVIALPKVLNECATPTTTVTVTEPVLLCLRVACIPPNSVCSAGEPTGPTPHLPKTITLTEHGICTESVRIRENPQCNLCATCSTPQSDLTASTTEYPDNSWDQWSSPPSTTTTTTSDIGGSLVVPNNPGTITARNLPTDVPMSDGKNPGGPMSMSPTDNGLTTDAPMVGGKNPGGPMVSSGAPLLIASETSLPAGLLLPGGGGGGGPGGVPTVEGRHRRCRHTEVVSSTVSGLPCFCPVAPRTCPPGEIPTIPALPTSTITEGCTRSVIVGPRCECVVCA